MIGQGFFSARLAHRWVPRNLPHASVPRTAGRQMPGPALLIRWQTAVYYHLVAPPQASIVESVGIPPGPPGTALYQGGPVPPIITRKPVGDEQPRNTGFGFTI